MSESTTINKEDMLNPTFTGLFKQKLSGRVESLKEMSAWKLLKGQAVTVALMGSMAAIGLGLENQPGDATMVHAGPIHPGVEKSFNDPVRDATSKVDGPVHLQKLPDPQQVHLQKLPDPKQIHLQKLPTAHFQKEVNNRIHDPRVQEVSSRKTNMSFKERSGISIATNGDQNVYMVKGQSDKFLVVRDESNLHESLKTGYASPALKGDKEALDKVVRFAAHDAINAKGREKGESGYNFILKGGKELGYDNVRHKNGTSFTLSPEAAEKFKGLKGYHVEKSVVEDKAYVPRTPDPVTGKEPGPSFF